MSAVSRKKQGGPRSAVRNPSRAPSRKRELTGVFDALAQHHREVHELMELAKSTTIKTRRAELWNEIRAELRAHERAETSQVFSVLEQHPLMRALTRYHRREAVALEQVIERLDALDPASNRWERLFRSLADTIDQHATEEERELFPRAQRAIGRELAQFLVRPYLTEKVRAKAEAAHGAKVKPT
jgi:hypothetical protein